MFKSRGISASSLPHPRCSAVDPMQERKRFRARHLLVHVATAPPADEATEINKELSNPISSIWALQIQENTYFIHPGIEDKSSRNSVNVQFQPVLRWL